VSVHSHLISVPFSVGMSRVRHTFSCRPAQKSRIARSPTNWITPQSGSRGGVGRTSASLIPWGARGSGQKNDTAADGQHCDRAPAKPAESSSGGGIGGGRRGPLHGVLLPAVTPVKAEPLDVHRQELGVAGPGLRGRAPLGPRLITGRSVAHAPLFFLLRSSPQPGNPPAPLRLRHPAAAGSFI